ncbi:putative pentatricopeptide repeat-containing protein At3g18840 [Arabidopsis lyrata subsp. lyrata]|nr:putative pentatricopeptide repeat-containing protein At3g18840 [Arabidopsis lyrata subsp. lyrata]|eukprot:XP_002883154.2 putative pentatricopeptide repeat-containing protein At3g18840 [Arabidopsis lyrata subsp. lyrata]
MSLKLDMKCLKDGFLHHIRSIKTGSTLTTISSNQLVNLYSKNGLLREARNVFDEMPERNVYSWNAVIAAYVKFNNVKEARELFKRDNCERDLITYNTLLSGFAKTDGCESEAIKMFGEMHRKEKDEIWIDDFSVTTMVKLSAKLTNVFYGEQLHGVMVKTGNDATKFSVSSLIHMYSKCGKFKEVCNVFNGSCVEFVDSVARNAMIAAYCREGDIDKALSIFWRNPELNDTISWNTLISGYAQNGYEEEALKIAVSMEESGLKWDEHTFAAVLNVLSSLKSLKIGKEVHARLLKNGSYSNKFVSSGIVDVYCKCGNMKYAESAHLLYGFGNLYSTSSMIVGYSSQGKMGEAKRLFDSLSEKNLVVWTAMFLGYLNLRQPDSVLELARDFIANETNVPDSLVMVSVLGACSLQAYMEPGKEIHGHSLRTGILMDKKLVTAFVDMYSKCGNVEYAERIFDISFERDTVMYNTMIAGYAHHGHEAKSFQLFEDMTEGGFKPDEITFMALLSACRHRGLVLAGEKYFKSMIEAYNISPEAGHYTCMIDLYGKANRLDKAIELMEGIDQVEKDAVILGAFLNACSWNKNTELVKEVEEKLLAIEGSNGSRYIQLANAYASSGRWDEMQRIRHQMRGKELEKFSGCSLAYIDNQVHMFTSSDISHIKTEAIYSMLHFVTKDLSEISEYMI